MTIDINHNIGDVIWTCYKDADMENYGVLPYRVDEIRYVTESETNENVIVYNSHPLYLETEEIGQSLSIRINLPEDKCFFSEEEAIAKCNQLNSGNE